MHDPTDDTPPRDDDGFPVPPYCYGCGREAGTPEQASMQTFWCGHCIRAYKAKRINFTEERFLFEGEPIEGGDVRVDVDGEVVVMLPPQTVKPGELDRELNKPLPLQDQYGEEFEVWGPMNILVPKKGGG